MKKLQLQLRVKSGFYRDSESSAIINRDKKSISQLHEKEKKDSGKTKISEIRIK